MKNTTYPTYFYLFTGILFLLLAVRDIMSFESQLEWILFIILLAGIGVSYQIKVNWFAFYHYILLIFYNPLFLVSHNIQNSYIADIGVGISFFLIGLYWERYVAKED